MKKTSSGSLWWLVLSSLWVWQTAAVAQQGAYGSGLIFDNGLTYGNSPTNSFQSQSNNFQTPPLGPTAPGAGRLGAAYMGTSALGGSSALNPVSIPSGPGLVEWGPFDVYPHLLYRMTYGNAIEAQPGINSYTLVNTVAPGLLFRMGSHWTLDYTPSLSFYSNPLFRNTTDQSVALNGTTTYGDWSLNLSQSYVDTTQPLVETGTQVEQVAYATALNADWQMSGKMSLQLGLNQNFRFLQGLNNLHEWSTADWLNYQFEPQLGAALGLTGGYDQMSVGPDMPFEQVLGRLIFDPGTKLNLTLVGGAEKRQFVKPSAPALLSPIFDASARYQIRDGTLLTVEGRRTVTPSLYGNEVNTITTVTANIRQKIVGNLNFEVSGGYTSEPYTSIEPGALPQWFIGPPPRTTLVVTRSDTRTYAQFRLSTVFRNRLTGSVFYMVSEEASTQANFSYSGNQVGLELSYRY
jgi:hypothetical protein